jgi:hypothetical protein
MTPLSVTLCACEYPDDVIVLDKGITCNTCPFEFNNYRIVGQTFVTGMPLEPSPKSHFLT